MLMIGDQLGTDIRGARAFGLDAVLVCTGVSQAIPPDLPAALRPTYRLRTIAPHAVKQPPEATSGPQAE
jgi:ribonucleotide monophosphatase NagD (HAD superfamily)